MSTISSPQEAYEALCRGEFFQVGKTLINPDDIVRLDRNGGEDPIFYLEDGTTVQHDKYEEGSAGDLLAEALSVAGRAAGQSEEVFLIDNRVLYTGDDSNGDTVSYSFGTKKDLGTLGNKKALSTIANPRGVFVGANGENLYVAGEDGGNNQKLERYNLGDIYDISTASFVSNNPNRSHAGSTGAIEGVFFKPDGTKMYLVDVSNGDVEQFTLSTAYDPSTASLDVEYSTGQISPSGIDFNDDGTKMYVSDQYADQIERHDLSSAWDLTGTVSNAQNEAVGTTDPVGVVVNGLKLYVSYPSQIEEYDLSSTGDLSSKTKQNTFSAEGHGLFIP